jgi:hypothetical protein
MSLARYAFLTAVSGCACVRHNQAATFFFCFFFFFLFSAEPGGWKTLVMSVDEEATVWPRRIVWLVVMNGDEW